MIIASEIRQKLPEDSSRLEKLARQFSDFHDSEVYVAQAEYQALMDATNVEDGKPLDNGKALIFNVDLNISSSPTAVFKGQEYKFEEGGPGEEAYSQISGFTEERPKIIPYFRKDIHDRYVELKRSVKVAADEFVKKMIKEFFGNDYRGINLFATMFSEGEPSYVPSFTFGQKSGHWDYASDFIREGKKSITPAKLIENPWAFDDELTEIILKEMRESHKTTRFVQWAIGRQPPPNEVRVGTYDIVYAGNEPEIEDTTGIAPTLARVGGLVITEGGYLSDVLLHGHRNMRPFFTTEHYISEAQFLMKTK